MKIIACLALSLCIFNGSNIGAMAQEEIKALVTDIKKITAFGPSKCFWQINNPASAESIASCVQQLKTNFGNRMLEDRKKDDYQELRILLYPETNDPKLVDVSVLANNEKNIDHETKRTLLGASVILGSMIPTLIGLCKVGRLFNMHLLANFGFGTVKNAPAMGSKSYLGLGLAGIALGGYYTYHSHKKLRSRESLEYCLQSISCQSIM